MPSRNKIAANASIFQRLDSYCVNRGEPVANEGAGRWIETGEQDREFLVYARLVQMLSLSPSLKIARFDYAKRSFFITAGFDLLETPEAMQEEDLSGGILTACLSEMALRPIAKPIEIRDVVEVGDVTLGGYFGHDPFQMASLFPSIQILSSELLVQDESANVFLLLCLSDRRRYDHWIDNELAAKITKMANISATAIPYEVLCRAVLDFDPAALFLALYRSQEALYSREKTMALISSLGISRSWLEMAQQLEFHLSWYPREEPSLEALFRSASLPDLARLLKALGEGLKEDNNIQAFAARRVYALRNALVHYRPFHQAYSFDKIDWNRLCEAMSSLVMDFYDTTATRTKDSESETPRKDAGLASGSPA
jgi:hypothetical protein